MNKVSKTHTKQMITNASFPTKKTEELAVEYVTLVYGGMDKVDAYKEVFPDRYATFEKRALSERRNVRKTVAHHAQVYEQGKYVKSLYDACNKHYYTRFVHKKTNLLDKLYSIAMDDGEEMKHRLVAGKTFLSSAPEPEKVINHHVDVDVKNDFKAKLLAKKNEIYGLANNEDEILDAEVEGYEEV